MAYDRVLRRQLLMDVEPRQAFLLAMIGVGAAFVLLFLLTFNLFVAVLCGQRRTSCHLVVRHLEQKRRTKLESQLVDGLTTLSAGVKAGLNLVQSMEMVRDNHVGPIKQEFEQMLREHTMGRE